MGKQEVVYTYKIYYSALKKGNSDMWRHSTKWNKPVTKRQILYAYTYMRHLE